MEKEFVTYELALRMKSLGFDEPCFGFYSPIHDLMICNTKAVNDIEGECLAPTYSQVFKWFREKYDLFGCIDLQACTPSHWYIRIDNIEINDYLYHSEDEHLRFNTYEEAELACLEKLLEIVENIKK